MGGGTSIGSGAKPTDPSQPPGEGGLLTAGDWDDNLNFDLFRAYVDGHNKDQSSAVFDSSDRIVITVTTEDGAPVSNALVEITDPTHRFVHAPTSSDGRVLFFPSQDGAPKPGAFMLHVEPPADQQGAAAVMMPLSALEKTVTVKLKGAHAAPPTALDLAFVLDTTGSMGDELSYLQSEIQGISNAVQAKFANVSIRYGLILYRDTGDEYVTRVFDFTADLEAFKSSLEKQAAGGGGDFPEAMDEAMALVPDLSWRDGNTARMTFLVADAPPHDGAIEDTVDAINALRPLGVKLYPVAASGVDPEAEYVMRVGAEATLGRYLFLTDDSGVGAPHAEPKIPCYQVQKLNTLIGRVIASELAGVRIPAASADVIRAVGDPNEGVCKLSDGSEAYL